MKVLLRPPFCPYCPPSQLVGIQWAIPQDPGAALSDQGSCPHALIKSLFAPEMSQEFLLGVDSGPLTF